ncbi:MAG: hypothetical protein HC917_10805, partial [Richelia sp. SM2_1_7]|nr:hypothetical protein [Richelia sp. SM2_1_7]
RIIEIFYETLSRQTESKKSWQRHNLTTVNRVGGNRELGIGNWELGIGNWELGIGNW